MNAWSIVCLTDYRSDARGNLNKTRKKKGHGQPLKLQLSNQVPRLQIWHVNLRIAKSCSDQNEQENTCNSGRVNSHITWLTRAIDMGMSLGEKPRLWSWFCICATVHTLPVTNAHMNLIKLMWNFLLSIQWSPILLPTPNGFDNSSHFRNILFKANGNKSPLLERNPSRTSSRLKNFAHTNSETWSHGGHKMKTEVLHQKSYCKVAFDDPTLHLLIKTTKKVPLIQ